MEAMKIPKDNPERKVKMQAALKHAAEVPLKTARLASEALAGLSVCGGSISNHVASDYRSARYQLETAIRCAAENVFINAEGLEDKVFAEKILAEIKGYLSCCEAMQVP
jgi:formiminotetrahydrofolate cyclodeaminase